MRVLQDTSYQAGKIGIPISRFDNHIKGLQPFNNPANYTQIRSRTGRDSAKIRQQPTFDESRRGFIHQHHGKDLINVRNTSRFLAIHIQSR